MSHSDQLSSSRSKTYWIKTTNHIHRQQNLDIGLDKQEQRIINVNAPTDSALDTEKEDFYDQLERLYNSIPTPRLVYKDKVTIDQLRSMLSLRSNDNIRP